MQESSGIRKRKQAVLFLWKATGTERWFWLVVSSWSLWGMGCTAPLPEQDCVRTRVLAPYTFELRYRSPIQEAKRKAKDEKAWEAQLEKEKYMRYFDLKITASPQVWQHHALDWAYGFQKVIHLEEESVQFPCVLYHHEPFSGGENSKVFVLGFENPQARPDPGTVVIDATALQVGVVKLHPHCE